MNIIWLFQVKSSSLINVFFTYKLVALLFNFRTSCKLQPKYDVAFVGDSSIIGYFCGRQLLSRQHQPCSPKFKQTYKIMFTEYLNAPSPWMCRLLKTVVWVWGNWGISLNSNEASRYTGHKKGAKKKQRKKEICVCILTSLKVTIC